MNKILVYTSNLKSKPKSLTDVINFAKENDKFRICNVGQKAQYDNGDLIGADLTLENRFFESNKII